MLAERHCRQVGEHFPRQREATRGPKAPAIHETARTRTIEIATRRS
jgi:hypothetical protein